MNKSVQKYLSENIAIISKILLVYTLGVIIGIVLFIFTDIKGEYIDIVRNILEQTKQENFESINVIANGLKNNLFFIGLIYSSIITIISPLIICAIMIIKAIVTGIYLCTIFSIFGILKGIGAVAVNVILPLILSLIGYVIICTNAINLFSDINSGNKITLKDVIKQLYWLVISFSLISFSLVIEQLTSSLVISMFSNI
ncbi:MAG: hypothetical protein J6A15_05100 [Clostridia bacterium]|nr:hypothetical protein [Clostridia bacterium]